jgi:hypothetical protein
MTRKNQLRRTGTRLQKHGALWFQQTRHAGGTFLEEAQDAGLTFGRDLKASSAKFVVTAGHSTQAFQKALHKEALDWQGLVLQTRNAYMTALRERRSRVERQALRTRQALKPGAVEKAVLQSARDVLERAQGRVDARLAAGTPPAAAKAVGKPKAAKAPKAGVKTPPSPLRNYDQLTARDVVNRVQRLSAPQACAVLDYERAGKRRATVIRAVEQRLAMAS